MKFFLDTAHAESIKKWADTKILDGVTTNPTHLSKESGSPRELVTSIAQIMGKKPVSVEVTEKSPDAVFEQAQKIAALAPNIVVKIPCSLEYVRVIEKLVNKNIAINITLVFSPLQALMMAKLGVMYVSPFIGRLQDAGGDGLRLISDIREIFDTYGCSTEILAASVRSVWHMEQMALNGADIATVSISTLEKALYHALTQQGIEQFDADWKKLGIRQFP